MTKGQVLTEQRRRPRPIKRRFNNHWRWLPRISVRILLVNHVSPFKSTQKTLVYLQNCHAHVCACSVPNYQIHDLSLSKLYHPSLSISLLVYLLRNRSRHRNSLTVLEKLNLPLTPSIRFSLHGLLSCS